MEVRVAISNRAERDDVREIYKMVLGRLPESDAAAANLVGMPVAAVINALLNSEECKRRRLSDLENEYFYQFKPSHVEIDGTPVELAELRARVETVWRRYGDNNAYWSVLTDERYRKEAFNGGVEEDFYATGAREFDAFIAACARSGVRLNFGGAVVDLGCGVWRVGEHLSRKFRNYVGVDISASHLALAQSRVDKVRAKGVEFRLLPDFLQGDETFDAFYSVIALQHNPPPVIADLLRACLGKLNPGGIGCFQLVCSLFDYEFRLRDYLRRPHSTEMEMHALPQQKLFALIEDQSCELLEIWPDGRAGNIGQSFSVLVRKR